MLLSCENADLGYGGKIVVHELTFSVSAGDFLCVIGENGAGKSTLIKTLLGLVSPVSGQICYGDGLKKKEIGYLPQQTDIQRDFPASVREIVRSGCLNRSSLRPFYTAAEKDRAEEIMNRLGIGSLARQSYRELSGGQQQRVLLARALCATSKLLVLDEPAAGLDPAATADMYGEIEKLNRKDGITVVMVTHDLPPSVRLATHILHLAHIPQFFGTKNDYLASDVGKAFLAKAASETAANG